MKRLDVSLFLDNFRHAPTGRRFRLAAALMAVFATSPATAAVTHTPLLFSSFYGITVDATLNHTSPATAAVTNTPLPFSSFYGITVDAARNRIFVTGGAGNDSVLVFDDGGALVTTIENVAGASGMAIVGDTLYVAAYAGARIDTIDLAASPPVKSGVIDLSLLYQEPQEIAFAGGRLWFTARPIGGSTREAAVVAPNGDGLQPAGPLAGDRFATSPTDPDALFTYGSSTSPASMFRYDASTVPATAVSNRQNLPGGISDLTVTADGSRLLAATGEFRHIIEFRIADLAFLQQYRNYSSAVATTGAAGGRVAAGGWWQDPGVAVYHPGEAKPYWDGGLDPSIRVLARGLAWSPDGSRLYAVAGDVEHAYSLHVFTPRESQLTLETSAASIGPGEAVTITARLSGGETNRRVVVYEAKRLGVQEAVGAGDVDAGGTLIITIHPSESTFYRAEYAGDDTWGAAETPGIAVAVTGTRRNTGIGARLPFTRFYASAIDTAHGRAFLSGGPGNDGVLVVDRLGKITSTIDDIPGAAGMAVVGDSLFVAASCGARIDVVDLAVEPPTRTRSIELGPLFSVPTELAYAGGRLWFLGVPADDSDAAAGVVFPDGTGLQQAGPLSGDRFVTSPTDPNALLTFTQWDFPGTIYRYDASTAPPTLQVSLRDPGGAGGDVKDLAVEADGVYLVTASAVPHYLQEFRVEDLTLARTSQPVDGWTTAVDTSAAYGGLIACAVYEGASDVYTYHPGTAQPFWSYDFDWSGYSVVDQGIAWGADGRSLLVMASNINREHLDLISLDPFLQQASLTLTASPKVLDFKERTTLIARLVGGATNRMVTIYATPKGGATTAVATGAVNAEGVLKIRVKPLKNTVYRAVYGGDDDWDAATSSTVSVGVRARVTGTLQGAYGTSGQYSLYHTANRVYYRVAVRPTHPKATVTINLEAFLGGTWRRLGSQDISLWADGTTKVYLAVSKWPPGTLARFQTVFPADTDHRGGTSASSYFMVTP